MNGNATDYGETNDTRDMVMETENAGPDVPAGIGSTISGITGDMNESETNGGTGRLVAQVVVARGALPVSGATVTIMDSKGNVIGTQTTDNSGRTPGISLPAPSFEISQKPGTIRPYSTYNMRIENPGFYTQEFLNVEVFDRTESIQPVLLEPLGENATEGDRLFVTNEATPEVL